MQKYRNYHQIIIAPNQQGGKVTDNEEKNVVEL